LGKFWEKWEKIWEIFLENLVKKWEKIWKFGKFFGNLGKILYNSAKFQKKFGKNKIENSHNSL
jgi:hypothetical protein